MKTVNAVFESIICFFIIFKVTMYYQFCIGNGLIHAMRWILTKSTHCAWNKSVDWNIVTTGELVKIHLNA